MSKCVLIASTKNEGLYLLEWIAYHKTIGFDEIIVASNDDSDGSDSLLQALADAGWIRYVKNTIKEGESPQFSAYRKIHQHPVYLGSDYAMILDADEFLNLKRHTSVQQFVTDYPNSDAIAIFWRYFGSSGNCHWSDDLVIERFQTCASPFHPINAHFKTLFRVSDKVKGLGIHKPLFDLNLFKSGKIRYDYLTENALDAEVVIESKHPKAIGIDKIDTSIAQVNHYAVKSLQEFEIRRARGNGFDLTKQDHFSWRQFFLRDRNETRDNSLLAYKKQISALITRMLSDSSVQKTYKKIVDYYSNKFYEEIQLEKKHPKILYIQLFCERHTETNSIQKAIRENYDVQILRGDEELSVIKKLEQETKNIFKSPVARMEYNESLRDYYWQKPNDISFGWKHGRVNTPFISNSGLKSRVLFLCVTSNPYHWLVSLHQKPYHVFGDILKDNSVSFSDFIRNPWVTRHREYANKIVNNPIELWNTKVLSYFELAGITPNTIIIKYEEINSSNTSVFNYLDLFIEKKGVTSKGFELSPSATGGLSPDNQHQINILETISKDDIKYINSQLNRALMAKLGYPIEEPR